MDAVPSERWLPPVRDRKPPRSRPQPREESRTSPCNRPQARQHSRTAVRFPFQPQTASRTTTSTKTLVSPRDPPGRSFPKGRKIRARQKRTNKFPPDRNNQSNVLIAQPRRANIFSFAASGKISVMRTKRTTKPALAGYTGLCRSRPSARGYPVRFRSRYGSAVVESAYQFFAVFRPDHQGCSITSAELSRQNPQTHPTDR